MLARWSNSLSGRAFQFAARRYNISGRSRFWLYEGFKILNHGAGLARGLGSGVSLGLRPSGD
jgi:hypothetical protein